MILVLFPQLNGPTINWLSDLGQAQCSDSAPGFMKLQAVLIPRQLTELQQPSGLRLLVGNHLLILHHMHEAGQKILPVLHQLPEVIVVLPDFTQVGGIHVTIIKIMLVNRQADVGRVTPAIDHLGIGQHQVNHPHMKKVTRHLVGNVTALFAMLA